MKTKDDHYTVEIFGNRPGRPRKLNAMTGAERVRKHRANKAQAQQAISGTCNENKTCNCCGVQHDKHHGICMTGQLGNK